ncbi:MAG TPA: DivIVA domain-containing protein [Thermoleophilaceae bacterium]|nr:DivIVA domain-containing protein [Thermoleophilaceae bacterium]
MELDRNAIERSDFAQARRGYDPDEVDAHLSKVAAAYEQLEAKPAAASATMASTAADQVRTIVEAAERTAVEIESGARTEAERVTGEAQRQAEQERVQARNDAAQARDRAESDAEAHVASVRDATAELRSRAEAMQADLNGMVEKLRESIDAIVDSARSNASSLDSELQAAQSGQAHEDEPEGETDESDALVADALEAPPEPATAYDEELLDEPVAEAAEEPEADPQLTPEPEPLVREPVASPEPELAPATPPTGGGGDGAEGARLIALNMALNGTPREETSRYLEENFDLENRETILDEVYSRVGG